MAKKNIGATLFLAAGNFFTQIKSASSATDGFKGKVKGMHGVLGSSSSIFSAAGGGVKSFAGKVVGAVAAVASVKSVVSFAQDCVAASNASEAAGKRLEQTMSNVKGTTIEQINSIKDYASELQKLTSVEDDVAIHGASQLATFQLQADTIKTLMPALGDLSVAQYGVSVSSEQMQSMANLMGKVMTGSVSALTRYGVIMDDAQKNILKNGTEAERAAMLVNVLKQNYGGLAEAMASTPEGRIEQMKNAWGDVQELIGSKLYPVITQTLNWAAEKIPTVQNVLTGAVEACQPVFTAFTNSILPAADRLFTSFKNIGTAIVSSFGEGATGGISSLATTIIPGLIDVLATAGNGIAGVIENWNTFKPVVIGVAAVIGAYKAAVVVCNVVEGVHKTFVNLSKIAHLGKSKAVDTDAKSHRSLKTSIQSATGTVKSFIASAKLQTSIVLASVKTKVKSTAATVKNTAVLAANKAGIIAHSVASKAAAVATKAVTAGQWLLNAAFMASPIGWIVLGVGAIVAAFAILWNKSEGFRNFWKNLWSGIKNAAGTAFNALKETISGVVTAFKEKFESIKNTVKAAIEKIKGFFKFDWKLPKLKLPHFNITGSFSLNPPSMPKIGVEWYKKGGIMTRPTVFGRNGNNVMAGGEAGAEAILPLKLFWDKLRDYTTQKPISGGNNINIELNVNITGTEDAEAMADKVINVLVPKLKLALENM